MKRSKNIPALIAATGMDMVKRPSLASIRKKIAKAKLPVVLKVEAAWCSPCKALSKTLDALKPEYEGRVEFMTYDVTGRESTLAEFGTRSIPLLVLMKDGEAVAQVVGAIGAPAIRKLIEKGLEVS